MWQLIRQAVIAGVLIVTAIAATAAPPAPQQVIDNLHTLLQDTLRNAKMLGIDGRFARIDPRIGEFYNFERMITIVAGSAWANGTPQQQRELLTAFTDWSAMTYAARFNKDNGETFETLGSRPGPRDTVFVDTRVNRPSEGPVLITYVMAQSGDRWQIVDVLLQGSISQLAQQRNDFAATLRDGGLPKLTLALTAKTEQLRTE
jgi:phospholipid transport system substrate-binding protein